MRDRLIELLSGKSIDTQPDVEYVADYLLENGVLVPPCKVRDTVYLIPTYEGKPYCGIVEDKVQMIGITSRGIHIKARNHHDHNKMYMLGKGAFLSKEEAEKALKGGMK
jgi:hypothetical protein